MLAKKLVSKNIRLFSNSSWRHFLNKICRRIDKKNIGLQIISPFGFELLENKNFIYKAIKRFYCYIGVPASNSDTCTPEEISNNFSKEFMKSIREIGMNQSDIAILVIQDSFNLLHKSDYQCKHSDKLIDIQTKMITMDILHHYANYIICTVDSILSKKEEPKHFFENKRHRCRTYQLYVMLEKIFGYLLPPMPFSQKINFNSIFKRIDNSIQMFYSNKELFIEAADDDMYILNNLINPRVKLMQQAIRIESSSDKLIKLQCDAYHVYDKLELIINKKIYETAVNKIKMTYLNFI